MVQKIKIDNWSVVGKPKTLYTAPELVSRCLHGNVYNHHRIKDGLLITTSSIKDIEARLIWTYSGSCYLLGKIDKGYRKWLKENLPNWDWRNPIVTV